MEEMDLRALFLWLREKGLIFNVSKCEYGKDKLEFFGYVFFLDSILLDLKKVEDVVNI